MNKDDRRSSQNYFGRHPRALAASVGTLPAGRLGIRAWDP